MLTVAVPILSLICLAMVRKACSTLEAFLADVSRKGMPRLSANSYERVNVHSRIIIIVVVILTLATV